MSQAKRTTISISEGLYQKALDLMKARDFGDFSGFLQQLIREEHDRRNPAILQDRINPEEDPTSRPIKKYPRPKTIHKIKLPDHKG